MKYTELGTMVQCVLNQNETSFHTLVFHRITSTDGWPLMVHCSHNSSTSCTGFACYKGDSLFVCALPGGLPDSKFIS